MMRSLQRYFLFCLFGMLCVSPPGVIARPEAPRQPPKGIVADRTSSDWPLFRGNPTQTGIATSRLPKDLKVRWTFKTKDSIESAAAMSGRTVYVASMDKHLYAIDLDSGQARWQYDCAPIKAPPSVHDDAVYVGDTDGTFHCVDAKTGKARWTFSTSTEISTGANFTRDAILFGCDDENLYCLSRDGKPRWKFKVAGGPVLGTPAIIDGRTFAAGCDSTLHTLDTASGKEIGTPVDLGGQVGASAAIIDDKLYVGTMTNQVLGIDWKKGEVLWRHESRRRQQFYASAAVTEKLVIIGCRDKHVYALDRKTGEPAWSFATRGKVDSSPVVVDQRVFFGSGDGNLYEVNLANGSELKKYYLGSEIIASPAVAGNCLVIGTSEGIVHCFGADK